MRDKNRKPKIKVNNLVRSSNILHICIKHLSNYLGFFLKKNKMRCWKKCSQTSFCAGFCSYLHSQGPFIGRYRGLSNIFHICIHRFTALMIQTRRISGWMVNNCACSIQVCVLRINRNCKSLEASVVFHAIFTQHLC